MANYRPALILSVIFCLSTGAAGAEDKNAAKITGSVSGTGSGAGAAAETITGYLLDRSCAAAIKHDHADPTKRLQDHTRSCSLEPSCSDAGYTVYSGGRWIDLDPASNALAAKVIKGSKKEKNLMCKMTGVVKRNEFHATTLSEVGQ